MAGCNTATYNRREKLQVTHNVREFLLGDHPQPLDDVMLTNKNLGYILGRVQNLSLGRKPPTTRLSFITYGLSLNPYVTWRQTAAQYITNPDI
jgi:hypothetical protein